jgi:hypothetical protein
MCRCAEVHMCRGAEMQRCRHAEMLRCRHAEVQRFSLKNWNPDSAKMNILNTAAQRLFLKKFDINKKY